MLTDTRQIRKGDLVFWNESANGGGGGGGGGPKKLRLKGVGGKGCGLSRHGAHPHRGKSKKIKRRAIVAKITIKQPLG